MAFPPVPLQRIALLAAGVPLTTAARQPRLAGCRSYHVQHQKDGAVSVKTVFSLFLSVRGVCITFKCSRGGATSVEGPLSTTAPLAVTPAAETPGRLLGGLSLSSSHASEEDSSNGRDQLPPSKRGRDFTACHSLGSG